MHPVLSPLHLQEVFQQRVLLQRVFQIRVLPFRESVVAWPRNKRQGFIL
ncbi:hypothetical protein Pint_32788 [Pistacia integerrima]|uniref:Uncharacterized protein n=2 Tax=Pistacia TaxID=55512 RepID=A0ACC1AC30_9ROSI|nr:hypothetical protein Pint_32788 [Pistacia integerrima]KAJ0083918.1 hypothetical protein Patl1_31305 [Pistacia atlantica]